MIIHPLLISVCAPHARVFHFLADIENLPSWAGGWCERIELQRGRWWALTAEGELVMEMETSAGTGVIDLRAGPSLDRMHRTPIRVVALSPRRTLVSILLVEAPDESAESCVRRLQIFETAVHGLLTRFGGGEIHATTLTPQFAEQGLN